MDSFHSTLQAIKWVSSVDQYIYIYSTLRVLSLLSLLYIIIYLYIFDISNDQVSICPWSYIQPVIFETSTQSWLKEHLNTFFQKRDEEGRGCSRAIQIPTSLRTGKQSRRTTRVLDKIYLGIYTQYIQYIPIPIYIVYTNLRTGEQPKRTTRVLDRTLGFTRQQEHSIIEATVKTEHILRLLGIASNTTWQNFSANKKMSSLYAKRFFLIFELKMGRSA